MPRPAPVVVSLQPSLLEGGTKLTVKVNSMSTSKFFYECIFFEIGLAFVLNIVIKGKHNLAVVVNLGRSDVEELLDNRK